MSSLGQPISKPIGGGAQGLFGLLNVPQPAGPQMLNQPLRPSGLQMSNQINSYNNKYGSINQVNHKRSLVVMNALPAGA